jgi:AraC family transcriptional regulator
MSIAAQALAAGPGWRALDVVCTHGPQDRPFEERHGDVSIAAVTAGMFQYRTRQGAALLAPGSLLLGNAGACFQCGHAHGQGDRCLAFHFSPEFVESVVADVPGARAIDFALPSLPPLPELTFVLASAEAAREERDGAAFEELALRLAGTVAALLAPTRSAARRPSARDEKRIANALRRIERDCHEPLTLAALAREAAMSRYHFLRSFAQVTGLTPHQYILRMRLHRAAVRLRWTCEAISAIAYDAGFNDLSTFNRRFRRMIGMSPGAFRARG